VAGFVDAQTRDFAGFFAVFAVRAAFFVDLVLAGVFLVLVGI
jgi:hypothetical protein